MTNGVSVYKENYWIKRFNEESIKITKEQYEKLELILLDTKAQFIKIDDRIINISSIQEMIKVSEKLFSEKFAESGNNPYFREWCSIPPPKDKFKDWILTSE